MKFSVALSAGLLLVSSAAAAEQSNPQINDAQIAAIVVTANQVDIDAGVIATTASTNAEVRKFAERMVTDHKSVNASAAALASKLKLTPEENETSKSLKAGGQTNVATLKNLKGAAFDKAYIDHEVAYHAQVIEALDKTLIPNAKNAELKALLVKVRPAFIAHLEHARQLQASKGGH